MSLLPVVAAALVRSRFLVEVPPARGVDAILCPAGWHVLRFVDIMNTFLDTHVLITLRTTQTRTGFYISVRVVDRDYLGAPGRQMAFFSTAKSRHLTPKIGCAVFPELRRAQFVSSEMPRVRAF
jgi:hypothetical protein